jgi:hypothetical protein
MKRTSRSHRSSSRSPRGGPRGRPRLTAADILRLQEHRLEADLTYRALAARIGIALSRIYTLLHNPFVTANDRTAFKVRKYLDAIHTRKPRAARAAARCTCQPSRNAEVG